MKKTKIKYHNIYLLCINIYVLYDFISKVFIYNYNNIDITIYMLLYIIYIILYVRYENKKNK